jgi:hypothetical protein
MCTLAVLVLIAQVGPVAAPAAKAKAQVLLTEGSRFYGDGDYASALDRFGAAYQAYPSPKLMFNIGQANRDLSRPVEAREAFEKYLATEDDPTSPTVAEATSSIEELQRRLGRIRVECETADAEVRLDGKSAGTTPLANVLWATPGRHQVTANHERSGLALEDVDVKAGVLNIVTLRLQPLATPPAPMQQSVAQTAESEHRWKWTWVAAGSTVALGVGAIVAGLAMQSKYDSLDSSCGSNSASGLGCTDISAVTTRRNIANVLWGLTGAAAITTGVLFYVERTSVTVVPLAGPITGALARATF